MNRKKVKLNILIIIIIIILVVSTLMIRFEFNPLSYFVDKEEKKEISSIDNINGIYVYRENLNKTVSLFSGCTLSYFDNYIAVINNSYHIYRTSCIGTFYIKNGKTKDLNFSETAEKTKYITLNDTKFHKIDYIDKVDVHNYIAEEYDNLGSVRPEYYKLLFNESGIKDSNFNLEEASFKMSSGGMNFNLFHAENNMFNFQIYNDETILYSVKTDNFDLLPDLKAFSNNLVMIELHSDNSRYHHKFKVLTKEGFIYDSNDKFPIKINNTVLTTDNSIYIKYNLSDNNYVMLVGYDKKFCEEKSESEEIAYYVFNINYNYTKKNFEKPKFIRIVYKKDGCKYINEVMGW